jgi:MoaA/NifB/PqqE/SkfB family radical SAM enzyme
LKALDYKRYMRELHPAVVQVSGGEPLLRPDIVDIVKTIKRSNGLPYLILVSNWSEMTKEKYLALRKAGVDQFSVSLDFPDNRHDRFRGLKGLYDKLSNLMPDLSGLGHDDIVLNVCITKENLPYLNQCADKAKEWGVNISYSAYSARRTGNKQLFPGDPEDLKRLQEQLDQIKHRMNHTHWIVNSLATLDATFDYFVNKGTPGCMSGRRFLVVTANGKLQPCSMQFLRYELTEQSKMIREFTLQNKCDECYVSIRSYLDKTFWQLFFESVGGHFGFKSRKAYQNRTGC